MEFYWERWEPTTNAPGPSSGPLAEAINMAFDSRRVQDLFLGIWTYWWNKFPDACILVTMTQNFFRGDNQELRFWFGEPNSFGYGVHVDSGGKHLIATVYGTNKQLRHLVDKVLPPGLFAEGVVDPPANAREHHTSPSSTVVWRRRPKV